MKRINRFLIILFFPVFVAGTAVAQDFMIYLNSALMTSGRTY